MMDKKDDMTVDDKDETGLALQVFLAEWERVTPTTSGRNMTKEEGMAPRVWKQEDMAGERPAEEIGSSAQPR